MALDNPTPLLEGGFSPFPLEPRPLDDDPAVEEQGREIDWLMLAKDAYTIGNDYLDASLRRQQEKNLDTFNSKHWRGSKYFTESYKFRSKIFRPKTRAAIRRNEAAAAIAFFSTQDNLSITTPDDDDKAKQAGARLLENLVNYRLSNSIPWFLTLVGAFQDTEKTGVVCSKQTWEFEEAPDDGMGSSEILGRKILKDEPHIELIPFENLLIDPASDWMNPIESSPFIIHKIPMRISDVMKRIESGKWKHYTREQVQTAVTDDFDSIRRAREGRNRVDAKDTHRGQAREFDIVWVHENIIEQGGEDYVFFSLGTQLLLSDAAPIGEVYLHGQRPFVMGFSILETHRIYPAGKPELTEGLQQEANDIANQRLDNVKLAMNKRYFAKRSAKVDWRSLKHNVPGSVTLMDQTNDVKVESTPDVTSSSYAEQDRINLDFDEIAGTFSPSSVQSNRKLNETVGGMNLLANDSSSMTEYDLRVFAESWVEPVLRQIVELEKKYETDESIIAIAGKDSDGEVVIDDNLLVSVNVGFGATDPMKRIAKLTVGLDTIAKYAPQVLTTLDFEEISKEVFGALGFKDGRRFFKTGEDDLDPQVKAMIDELQQQNQQMQQIIQQKQVEQQGKLAVEDKKQQGAIQLEAMREAHG